jgi:DNA-binding transcriptional LysR family regulator
MSMETLIAVVNTAEQRSMLRAGKEIGLSPSAVSKRIRAADQIVGSKIFQMTQDGLMLTRRGQTFYAEAIQALEHAYRAEEKTKAETLIEQKHLLIGHSTCLASRLLALLNNIRFDDDPDIHIHHTSGLTLELIQKVLTGTMHAGFGFLPLSHPELFVRQVYEEPLVACVPANHRLAARHMLHIQELVRAPWIAVARGPFPSAHEEIERCLHGYGVQLQIVADAYSPWEAEAYVEHKVGLCLMARSSAVARPGVVIKPVATRMLVRKSGVFVREDNHDPLLKRFIDASLMATEPLRWKPQSNA